jgi:hypothetical protein
MLRHIQEDISREISRSQSIETASGRLLSVKGCRGAENELSTLFHERISSLPLSSIPH